MTTPDEMVRVSIAKLDLAPTDILVLRWEQATLSREQRERIITAMQEILGEGQKILVLDAGAELEVLTRRDLEAWLAAEPGKLS